MNTKISLDHGNEFPFDAPDTFWKSDEPTPVVPARDWARAAARGIIADLQDRRGIKHELSTANIDEETRIELTESLAAIIRAAPSWWEGQREKL